MRGRYSPWGGKEEPGRAPNWNGLVFLPPPLRGRVGVGDEYALAANNPHPDPPPQRGREQFLMQRHKRAHRRAGILERDGFVHPGTAVDALDDAPGHLVL